MGDWEAEGRVVPRAAGGTVGVWEEMEGRGGEREAATAAAGGGSGDKGPGPLEGVATEASGWGDGDECLSLIHISEPTRPY